MATRRATRATARLTPEQGYGVYLPSEKEIEASGVRQWLDEIVAFPVLSPEEEYQLAMRVASGDSSAKQQFIMANLRLVVSVARRYAHAGIDLLDLVQEGNIGLMKAVEKFDYTRGNKFSTYATWWIRQTITRALAEKHRTVRIPTHADETARKILGIVSRLRNELGYEPSAQDIADAANREPVMRISGVRVRRDITVADIQMILGWTYEPLSLDIPMVEEEFDGSTFADALVDKQSAMPDEAIDHESLTVRVREALDTLPTQKYRDVIRLRYGLDGVGGEGEGRKLEEVATLLHITRERVRQIEARALRMLKPVLEREQWKDVSE